MVTEETPGWFADLDDETGPDRWQPCLDTEGWSPGLRVWFATKAECEAWIAEHLIGTGWADGAPTERPGAP